MRRIQVSLPRSPMRSQYFMSLKRAAINASHLACSLQTGIESHQAAQRLQMHMRRILSFVMSFLPCP